MLGRLEYQLQAQEPHLNLKMTATVGLDRTLRLENIQGHLPLPRAIGLAGRPPPPLVGTIKLDLKEVRLNRHGKPMAVRGKAYLSNVHTAFGKTLQFGNFVIQMDSDPNTMTAAITDTGGPLQFNGFLTLDTDQRYQLNGTFGVRTDSDPNLAKLLSLFARPNQQGIWRIAIRGKLTP